MAEIYEQAQLWGPAVDARRHAVAASPDDATLLLDMGLTLGKAGRWNEAARALREALALNPRDVRPLYYLGVVSQQLNSSGDARAAFTRFISLAPSRYDRQIQDAKQRLAAPGAP
jgi:Flp pilus assembly protein TadD